MSILGPRTRALFKTVTGVRRAVLVELMPASELVNRHVELVEGGESRVDAVAARLGSRPATTTRRT